MTVVPGFLSAPSSTSFSAFGSSWKDGPPAPARTTVVEELEETTTAGGGEWGVEKKSHSTLTSDAESPSPSVSLFSDLNDDDDGSGSVSCCSHEPPLEEGHAGAGATEEAILIGFVGL
jgi:hypothetical protein